MKKQTAKQNINLISSIHGLLRIVGFNEEHEKQSFLKEMILEVVNDIDEYYLSVNEIILKRLSFLSEGRYQVKNINFEFSLEGMEISSLCQGTVYYQIKHRVLEKPDLKVSAHNI